MIRIAWRNLRAHLRRFQMSLLAVVLGVAFLWNLGNLPDSR